jgi:hypothetical protein
MYEAVTRGYVKMSDYSTRLQNPLALALCDCVLPPKEEYNTEDGGGMFLGKYEDHGEEYTESQPRRSQHQIQHRDSCY